MAISSTNYVDFSYALETTPGTLVDDYNNYYRLPVTSIGMADNISTAVSEVIRSDRQTDDLVVVDAEVSGDCNYELSYDPYKPLMISLMQNATGIVTISETLTGVTAATATFAGSGFATSDIVAGTWIKTAGFVANTTNNGYFKVVSSTSTTIVVSDPDSVLVDETQAATATGTYIRNGADITPDTYSLRKDHGPASSVIAYKGCIVNSMSFNFETGAILNGSTNFIGRTSESNPTISTGTVADINDVVSYRIMNGVSSVTELRIGGLPAGTEFSNVNLTVDNQVNAAKAIGTLGAAELAAFSLQVTADMEIYFQNLSIYDNYKTATEFSVDMVLADNPTAAGEPSGNVLIITMPKCKFEELSEPIDGKDNFLMESGSFRALRDATNDYMIQFSFFDD